MVVSTTPKKHCHIHYQIQSFENVSNNVGEKVGKCTRSYHYKKNIFGLRKYDCYQ